MEAIEKLKQIVAKAPSLLLAMSPEEVSKPTAVGKWSKKQELGHLVDSACNNHQRAVRAQVEELPSLTEYDGDRWVALHSYQAMEWSEIIECWRVMNQQLIRAGSMISPQPRTAGLRLAEAIPSPWGFYSRTTWIISCIICDISAWILSSLRSCHRCSGSNRRHWVSHIQPAGT
jgi:hypothetical protein